MLDVVALGLNGVIGTGIFFLPGKVAAALGPAAVITFLISALLCTLLVLCFAEVGSRFRGTGGPMLYSQAAFGPLVGFVVGWLTWVIRVTSWGALANALVSAAASLVPAAAGHSFLIITVLIAGLAAINVLGVSMGARVTNFFTAAKLIPIVVFLAVGVFHLRADLFTPFAPHGLSAVAPSTLVILYAFVGFEVLTVPAGEMRDPQRSVPRALILVMAIVTGVYLLLWAVCAGTLPTLAGSENPVAEAATLFLGPAGGRLVALGILVSVLGINAGSALVAPRCLFALADQGYLPRSLARLHPTRHTPVVAIVLSAVLAWGLAVTGSFVELAVISVVARFAQYIPTCLAVLRLRSRPDVEAAGFRIAGGAVVPWLAILLCVALLAQSEARHLIGGAVGILSGVLLYLARKRANSDDRPSNA
ncbi:MAG: amino acid permease [Gemmatimonadota bacterium]|nr:MAG: amino acid permease [Gemmatimonadota bacterium]